MRLRIIDINFTTKQVWLFKLADENENVFYIMNESFYKNHSLKSPITKKEIDYYDKGQWINASIEQIEGKGIVVGV
jgi:hypothetical protein